MTPRASHVGGQSTWSVVDVTWPSWSGRVCEGFPFPNFWKIESHTWYQKLAGCSESNTGRSYLPWFLLPKVGLYSTNSRFGSRLAWEKAQGRNNVTIDKLMFPWVVYSVLSGLTSSGYRVVSFKAGKVFSVLMGSYVHKSRNLSTRSSIFVKAERMELTLVCSN